MTKFTNFPQFKPLSMVVISLLMLCLTCQNANCQQNQEKLYMLQIIEVPNSYANGRMVYSKDKLIYGIENHFIQVVNGINFFFRNGNDSQPKTPSNQINTPTNQPKIPTNQPNTPSNPPSNQPVTPPKNQQNIPSTHRPTIPPSNQPQNSPPAQKNDLSSNEKAKNDPGLHSSFQSQRSYLLYRLNDLRSQASVPPLHIDEDLNEIAQRHSDDMTRRGYFNHNTPEKVTPQMRAKSAGYCCLVGENIVRGTSLTHAHDRLEASKSHYINSIKRSWSRVGFGLSLKNGELFLTVLFSGRDYASHAVSSSEFALVKKGFIDIIYERNPRITTENPSLSQDIDSWMRSDRKIPLMKYLRLKKYMTLLFWKRIMGSFSEKVYEEFKNDDALQSPSLNYRKVGIGITVSENGLMDMYIVYSS